jgi:hypothetical protein
LVSVALKERRLVVKRLFESVNYFDILIGEINCENAINFREQDFSSFLTWSIDKMVLHANSFKDFNIPDYHSIDLFKVISGSINSWLPLKDEKLVRFCLVSDKFLPTDYC